MFAVRSFTFALVLAVVTATRNPIPDQVIIKRGDYLYYDNQAQKYNSHLVDKGVTESDVKNVVRFSPDIENVLHLYTRENPIQSQPILLNRDHQLATSNFNPKRRTAIIIHDWTESATSSANTVLVSAILKAADYNVFIYDWSAGASIRQADGPKNAVLSGLSLARAIDWICSRMGTSTDHFHLMGFGLGAHLAGVAGRNVQQGHIAYITSLDPETNSGQIFGLDAATYNEVIHNETIMMGQGEPLAHVDFSSNKHPRCGVSFSCNQDSHDEMKKLLTHNIYKRDLQGCNSRTIKLSDFLNVLDSVEDSSVNNYSYNKEVDSEVVSSTVQSSQIINSVVLSSTVINSRIYRSRVISCTVTGSSVSHCSLAAEIVVDKNKSCH